MRLTICLTAGLALAACNQQAAPPAADNAAMDVTETAPVMPAAMTTINETSWEFTDAKTGKAMQESVDAAGKYIVQSGKEHVDHGTAVMKAGKACFTSAMTKEGEVCWTDPMLAMGQSGETTSDKGVKLTVKRVDYTPMTM
ncbi:MAG: hypothetical protein ABIR63_04555 [Sphingomicrobium sp.]